MERLFNTHEVRRCRACEPVWTLTTLDAGGLDQPEKVIVPGVWEFHPALRNYRGRGVFRQSARFGGNVRLWFGGVSFRTKVYLDDRLLAEHYGAYTGFEARPNGRRSGSAPFLRSSSRPCWRIRRFPAYSSGSLPMSASMSHGRISAPERATIKALWTNTGDRKWRSGR